MSALIATRSQSSSVISHDDRFHILSKLPADAKALGAVFARIYHAPFGTPNSWSYTGLQGFLIFGRNVLAANDKRHSTSDGIYIQPTYWFRLIDSAADKGVIWMHQIPDGFEYLADKPFFHVFSGKSRMFGFRFDKDLEADKFYKKVTSKVETPASISRKTRKFSATFSSPSLHSLSRRHVTTNMISTPSPYSFVHLAHVGFDENGRVEAENVDEGWTAMLEELKGHGVNMNDLEDRGIDQHMLEKDQDFVMGFLAGAKAIQSQENEKHEQVREINGKRRKSLFLKSLRRI